MDDIESFNPSDWAPEGGQWSPEKSREQAEKQRESSKKAAAGIGRTQKDEWKAKKHDFLLANFLVEILLNKKYDFLLDDMFGLMDMAYPSNFILWVISLIHLPISYKIREMSWKETYIFRYLDAPEVAEFNDRDIDETMKTRINYWIEDIIDIVSIWPSTVSTLRLRNLISNDENVVIFVAKIFTFFLSENNLSISESKSKSYALFIIGEVGKALQKLNLEEV
jgi:hypothetical protein